MKGVANHILVGLVLVAVSGCDSLEFLWPPIEPTLCTALVRSPKDTIYGDSYYAALQKGRVIIGERRTFDDVRFYSLPAQPGQLLRSEGTDFAYSIGIASIDNDAVTFVLEDDRGCP